MVERIFISYRRDDSAGHAGRVFDRLRTDFGQDVLFMDVDAIPLGSNFVRVLREEVAKCGVLLAIIGPRWLDATDDDGERRLDNPNDFVRVEIAAALARDIPVIPILLEGARIPKAQALPDDLKELAERNGLDVRHASFHRDMDKLVRGLQTLSKPDHRAEMAAQPIVSSISSAPAELAASIRPNRSIDVQQVIPTVPSLASKSFWKGVLNAAGISELENLYGHLASAQHLIAIPTVDEVIAVRGQWLQDFDVDHNSATPPECFDHLFMSSIFRENQLTYGMILTGRRWYCEALPHWTIVRGYCGVSDWYNEYPHYLIYLGPTWRPEFADLSDAVFKKLGGVPLARFIRHP